MITVIIYGLDQYIVGHLSKELTPSLAKLYEVEEDEVSFVAPNNMVFHDGVEQTSWNVLIHVHAPLKVSVLQDDVAKFISTSIGDIAINLAIEFYYYSSDNRYERINHDYPRFITESNLVDTDMDQEYEDDMEEDDEEDCDCGHHHHHHEEGEGEDDIFTGDIFKDFHDDN